MVTGGTFVNQAQVRILANAGAADADARRYRLKWRQNFAADNLKRWRRNEPLANEVTKL